MASASEIVREVRRLLEGKTSLDDFEDWSASYSWNIRQRASKPVQDLAYLIELRMIEYGNGDMDESALFAQLGDAIRPFEESTNYGEVLRVEYGIPPWRATSATRPLALSGSAA